MWFLTRILNLLNEAEIVVHHILVVHIGPEADGRAGSVAPVVISLILTSEGAFKAKSDSIVDPSDLRLD